MVVIVSLSGLGAATIYTSTRCDAHLMEGTYRWQYQCRQGGENIGQLTITVRLLFDVRRMEQGQSKCQLPDSSRSHARD